MNDKWLDELREGMSDFEMDVPEGLWESLGVEKPVSKGNWRKRRIAAAAITLLIIGSGILMWMVKTEPIDKIDIKYAETNYKQGAPKTDNNLISNQKTAPVLIESPRMNLKKSPNIPIQNNSEKGKQDPETFISNEDNSLSLLDTVKTEESTPDNQAIISANKTKNENEVGPESEKTFYANIYPKKRMEDKGFSDRLAINVSASGIGHASKGRSYWESGLMNGNDIYAGNSLITTKIQHHMPFHLGLTLQYNITKKFAIESGLVYSVIGSDISISQDKFMSTATRRMHYVGIPLNVKFSAWSWKLIDLYLSAGATGEKCISNKLDIKHISDNLPLHDYANQREKPFQWSVNAAAGIQIRPTPNIGIFAEPGVSYYFNDGTTISTIYKDHPCNFNLNFGLRFNINP